MAARLISCAAWLIALLLLEINEAHSWESPPPAYQAAATAGGIPPTVLFAIALQESGTSLGGRLIPWPWTLGIAGKPHRYTTRVEACLALRSALRELPGTRVDIGLGQINFGYHGHRVDDPCALLDPHRNLAIATSIVSENHTPGDDWLVAIGRYHRPAGGELASRYRDRVNRHLTRLNSASPSPAAAKPNP